MEVRPKEGASHMVVSQNERSLSVKECSLIPNTIMGLHNAACPAVILQKVSECKPMNHGHPNILRKFRPPEKIATG